jgi:hypothetical protein
MEFLMSKKVGKEQSFLKSLQSGRVITRKQAMVQFKLGNPSATIHRLLTEQDINIKRSYKSRKIQGNLTTQVVRYFIA